jgi:thiamine biosynthesis lipoprotein
MLGTFLHLSAQTSQEAGVIYSRAMEIDAEAKASLSIFDERSLLSRINRGETDSIDRHIKFNLELASRITAISGGSYDVTVKPLVEAYGFAGKQRQSVVNIDSLLEFVGAEKLHIEGDRVVKSDSRVQIDFNSIAKGYTVDLLAEELEKMEIENYIVDIGGEVRCKGVNSKGGAWRIGIETPFDGNNTAGEHIQQVISLSDCALATSGNYRRFYLDESGRKVSHTIDPRTGLSVVSDLLSDTVIAPTCAEADAMSTMFMTMSKNQALSVARELQQQGIKVYFIASSSDGDYEVYYSSSLASGLKILDNMHAI